MNDHDHDDHAHHQDGHDGHVHEPISYSDQIGEQRASKDSFFKQSPHSPIPAHERSGFQGLAYYDVDASLRFAPVTLEPLGDDLPRATQVQTSDGAIRDGQRAGVFRFEVGGIEQRLTALQLEGSSGDALFVPFVDATSGSATYGAGRYLDLEPLPDGRYDLDFNLAYAPFCAYAEHYSCPLPPAENRLPVPITAGERER
ncbi:MAG: DUF1684 domain-containing protein [Chloroflexota bacterium]